MPWFAGAAGRMGNGSSRFCTRAGVKVTGAFERPGHPQPRPGCGRGRRRGLARRRHSGRAEQALRARRFLLDFTAPGRPCRISRRPAGPGRHGHRHHRDRRGGPTPLPGVLADDPVLRSPSMSVAVNAVFGTLAQLAGRWAMRTTSRSSRRTIISRRTRQRDGGSDGGGHRPRPRPRPEDRLASTVATAWSANRLQGDRRPSHPGRRHRRSTRCCSGASGSPSR